MQEEIEKLMRTKEAHGDYVGEDGLLYCGKCRTPKQMRMAKNPATGKAEPTIVPVVCRCRAESDVEAERMTKEKQFRDGMKALWEDGISCPGSLRFTFADDDRKQPSVSDACRRYVDRWEEMREDNIGLLFCGSVGTGKTFLADCIGTALLDKLVPVASTNFPRLLNLLQKTGDRQQLLDRLSRYKLLILDDLGVERDSSYATEQVFNVIDARARSQLPIVITTNLTLDDLVSPSTMQFARIYDRVLELCPVKFKLVGESRRNGNAERRKAKARELLLS